MSRSPLRAFPVAVEHQDAFTGDITDRFLAKAIRSGFGKGVQKILTRHVLNNGDIIGRFTGTPGTGQLGVYEYRLTDKKVSFQRVATRRAKKTRKRRDACGGDCGCEKCGDKKKKAKRDARTSLNQFRRIGSVNFQEQEADLYRRL